MVVKEEVLLINLLLLYLLDCKINKKREKCPKNHLRGPFLSVIVSDFEVVFPGVGGKDDDGKEHEGFNLGHGLR